MPLYVYVCPADHTTEVIRKVADRHDPVKCETCEREATLEVQTAQFDPRMGLDPSFPTMADRWANNRLKASRAKQ